MVVSELVEYLREHVALGYSVDDLKLQLVNFGHSTKNIEEAMNVLSQEALESLPAPSLPGGVSSMAHFWLLAPAMLFMLLFSIGVVVAVLRTPVI